MMNTIYILVVISMAHSGANVSFQEFHSLQACEMNAKYMQSTANNGGWTRIKSAYCTKK
jgi:hypothetical protein